MSGSGSVRLRIGLVAGEASGDTLGADLIAALRRLAPDAIFFGVAGPKMQAAGCECWEAAESLAVMGLADVLKDLPRLWRLLADLRRRFLAARPDVFVGIDAPDTNLRLAKALHAAGIATVQYVSPQVWAWRQGRVRGMRARVDLVLCLLPFEKRFYDEQGVPAQFVGHPLADAIPLVVDRAAARRELGLASEAPLVALLPGSRRGEVLRLGADFAAIVQWLAQHSPGLQFVAPMASAATRQIFSQALERHAPGLKDQVRLLDGQAQSALIAADAALVASGTASLEAALCGRPMVVVYRLGALTAWLVRRLKLVKSKYFAQPNLLAQRRIVGEYFQEEIVPASIGAELLMWLDDGSDAKARRAALQVEFARIHVELKREAGARAAQAIMALLAARPQPPWKMAARRIAGLDEAGRGPLAGPVVAAAVILRPRRPIDGVADSKVLCPEERTRLSIIIRRESLCFGIGWADRAEIDAINILQATFLAMRRAILSMPLLPDHLLIDGNQLPNLAGLGKALTARAIIGGDASHAAISAASILAKTARDSYMEQMHVVYPAYGFSSHKGYATPDHQRSLAEHGPCPLHRRSFEPVRLAVKCPP